MAWFDAIKQKAHQLKKELTALWFAYQDTRTPWYAKAATLAVVAYAASPIDLIPDFIPVFGYLDDMILVPLGIAMALKLIPANVMADARIKADRQAEGRLPGGKVVAFVIIIFWLAIIVWLGVILWRSFKH